MPWKVFPENGQHCVHKLNPDGSRGARVACHASRSEAMAQMAALYASEGMTKALASEQEGPAVKVCKVDEDERLVFGWASVSTDGDGSLVIDSDGEAIEPRELEQAVYDYVLEAREAGELHKGEAIGRMVESFVMTPEKASAMGLNVPQMTGWWFGVKVDSDEAFAKVKDGTYRCFSIQGTAVRG